jgi:hypothetical protein
VLHQKYLLATLVTKEFNTLWDILKSHFKPEGLKYQQRQIFNKRVQEATESIQEYDLDPNEMADKCYYNGASLQEHLLGLWLIALMMEAASTSETSVNFYQTTWHNNLEDSCLHTCCHENLKSHKGNFTFDRAVEIVIKQKTKYKRSLMEMRVQTVTKAPHQNYKQRAGNSRPHSRGRVNPRHLHILNKRIQVVHVEVRVVSPSQHSTGVAEPAHRGGNGNPQRNQQGCWSCGRFHNPNMCPAVIGQCCFAAGCATHHTAEIDVQLGFH